MTTPAEMRQMVQAHPFWYHTVDLAPGVSTPGWFDLRHAVAAWPWPDLEGKRCLDIGTYDGFLAFEMERRGAKEVVAIDVEDHLLWDWPPDYRSADLPRDPGFTGPPKGAGFRLIRDLIGSNVQWLPINVYDLDPDVIGSFDLVVMGSLLIHLRDPIRALEAVREVTAGHFLSSDQIALTLTVLGRRRPLYTLDGSGGFCQWFNFNRAGHERFLYAAGFETVARARPFGLRFNVHPKPPMNLHYGTKRAVQWVVTGDHHPGVLHDVLLTKPRI